MSIFNDINRQYAERFDGRDESALYSDLLASLDASDRELWQKEAEYDIAHRREYYEKYGEAAFKARIEDDILRLFEP